MTIITYNGQNLFDPLPLVGKESNFVFVGERWAIRETYTLNGNLISCDGYEALINSGKALINLFNQDFQDFVIVENSSEVLRKSGVIVESIEFANNNYAGTLPYTITLSCYPHSIQQVFGVLDPTDSWDFDENTDGIIKINHQVAARGYNNGLQKAIDFVRARTGASNYPSPQFLNLSGDFVLESQEENINRFNGEYSINESYNLDSKSSGLIARYTCAVESGLDGFIQTRLNGTIDGGLNSTITDVRNRYATLNPLSKVLNYYSLATDLNDLNQTPLNSGIVEDSFNKKLTFDLSFDNNPNNITSVDWITSVASGDEKTEVTVNGRVFGRGEQQNRWNLIQNHFGSINVYAMAQSGYNYYGGSYVLNRKALSSGISYNRFNSEITFSAAFDDRDGPPNGFVSFDYVVNVSPSVRKIVSHQLSAYENKDESFYTVDLNMYPKVRLSINGSAVLEENIPIALGKELLIQEIKRLFFIYATNEAFLNTKEISTNPEFGRQLDFQFSWIFESHRKVNYSPRFDIVADLNIK